MLSIQFLFQFFSEVPTTPSVLTFLFYVFWYSRILPFLIILKEKIVQESSSIKDGLYVVNYSAAAYKGTCNQFDERLTKKIEITKG